ncbi:MAG: DUF1552 domain-containing protein [Lentisphaeraceae bacterium]|nr:DUF1552 domain-containing protein [Lentisphaeraceae bacterium]
MNKYTRRAFLRCGSVALALPYLESFGFKKDYSKTTESKNPKRLMFLSMGFGVTGSDWYPDQKQTGANYTLPESLSPLKEVKKDVSIYQNLYHRNSKGGHWGSTFWLTGANQYGMPGRKFHNEVSVDQVAAEAFGKDTRFTSIQMNASTRNDGHGPGSSASWNKLGKSLSGHKDPLGLYHQLFSGDGVPVEVRKKALQNNQSVLDAVLIDAKTVKRGLTKTDVEKVDEYFESVREIEKRLEKEVNWIDIPKKKPSSPIAVPKEGLVGIDAVNTTLDLMVAAMQVDATRVFTYMLPIETILPQITDVKISPHTISHFGPGKSERRDISILRDQTNIKFIVRLIKKLKASKEVDGSSLFDHSTVVYGGNLSETHSLKNCPTLITGKGAGLKLGEHFVMEEKSKLCNLWLSILHGIGLPQKSFGDSTGIYEELFS